MTTLRTAAQQALEAMEYNRLDVGKFNRINAACQAIRAALAEPVQEPVEPVAKVELMTTGGNAGLATRIVEIDDHLRERLRPGQLLYTAPPQRKPLTEEEIDELSRTMVKGDRSVNWLCRAIERAHWIE